MFTHTEYAHDYHTFCTNPTYRNAIALCLMQIGELVKHLSPEFISLHTSILLNGADPAATPVKTFDNGTAAINTETCTALGLDFDTVSTAFELYCTKITTLTTAESFS